MIAILKLILEMMLNPRMLIRKRIQMILKKKLRQAMMNSQLMSHLKKLRLRKLQQKKSQLRKIMIKKKSLIQTRKLSSKITTRRYSRIQCSNASLKIVHLMI